MALVLAPEGPQSGAGGEVGNDFPTEPPERIVNW